MSETFRPVIGYEGSYEVSNLGNVRSVNRTITDAWGRTRRLKGVSLRGTITSHGYVKVAVLAPDKGEAWRYVHVLVAEAFIGPRPQGQQVAHGDGNRQNNRLENLRYATVADNQADRISHGTSNRGEKHGVAKLTCEQVAEIRLRLANGETQRVVAADFGVSRSAVGRIGQWQAWQHPCSDCAPRFGPDWRQGVAA